MFAYRGLATFPTGRVSFKLIQECYPKETFYYCAAPITREQIEHSASIHLNYATNVYYVLSEFVNGVNLRFYVDKNRSFLLTNPRSINNLYIQLAYALYQVQARGYIVLDFKLDNVIIDPNTNLLKLVDLEQTPTQESQPLKSNGLTHKFASMPARAVDRSPVKRLHQQIAERQQLSPERVAEHQVALHTHMTSPTTSSLSTSPPISEQLQRTLLLSSESSTKEQTAIYIQDRDVATKFLTVEAMPDMHGLVIFFLEIVLSRAEFEVLMTPCGYQTLRDKQATKEQLKLIFKGFVTSAPRRERGKPAVGEQREASVI